MQQIYNKKRPVRSFVRRAGRMSDHRKQILTTLWERYGLELKSGYLDFATLFNRTALCVLEIGFGMGQSLILQAQQNPQKDYVGIEVHTPGVAAVLAAIEKNQLSNIRLICDDAVEVLSQHIPKHTFDLVQIFFPDPWPKKRHHKRRLIQVQFIELLALKIKPGGKLHLATDWQEYAEHMLAVLSAADNFENLAGVGQFFPRPAERPLTKFELRGELLGHGVWDLMFVKR